MQLNKFQQAVIDNHDGPIVMDSAPGSGKTKVGENLVLHLIMEDGIDPMRIGYFTFNNKASAESRVRIAKTIWPDISAEELAFFADPFNADAAALAGIDRNWVEADPKRQFIVDWVCTIHALSFRLLKTTGYKFTVLGNNGRHKYESESIIKDYVAEAKWQEEPKRIKHWISKAILALIEPGQSKQWFAEQLEITDGPVWSAKNLSEAYKRYIDYCRKNRLCDFDMLLSDVVKLIRNNPSFKEKIASMFDYVIVDEAQDTSPEQSEILFTLASKTQNLLYCGDVDQCVVEGTLVLTPSGEIPVETIQESDIVMAGTGIGRLSPQSVLRTYRRKIENAPVVKITTKSGATIITTPEHIHFASHLSGFQGHFVYLMYREGMGYRIGRSRGRYNRRNPKNYATRFINRLGNEKGNKAWVINCHNTVGEAALWEQYYSVKYSIPTSVFEARGKLYSQDMVNWLFSAIDSSRGASELLRDANMFEAYPHHEVRSYTSKYRLLGTITICGSTNGNHNLFISGSDDSDGNLLRANGFPRVKSMPETKGYGRGWRLTKHFADLADLYTCVEQVKKVLPQIKIVERVHLLKDTSLDFMPASHVRKGMSIYVANNGVIVSDTVELVENLSYTGYVYDIDVSRVRNFVAGKIVTHNSMYKFRGAEPRVLREDFEAHWSGAKRYALPINYRSTKSIITASAKLIEHNYRENPEYLKELQGRPDAPDGEPLTYTELSDFTSLTSEITSVIKQSETPGNWFVLSRTRAECAAIHMALTSSGIKAINKSGGMVFGTPHVRKVLAYARLACNYNNARDDTDILKEIANVASNSFRAPMTRRRHLPTCREEKPWVNCGCPIVMEQDNDYSHSRFYGEKAIDDAGNWAGIIRQSYESNRGGYPTVRAKGAQDLLQFVNRIALLQNDAHAAITAIIANCVAPWLMAEEGITDDDLAENGKAEDFDLLLGLTEPGMTLEKYLTKLDELAMGGEKGSSAAESESVLIGTFHWSKGAERPCVIVNTTRCPIIPPANKPDQLPMGMPPTIAEERRLIFVGVSRGKDRVLIMGSRNWNNREVETSQFVAELEIRHTDGNDDNSDSGE